MQNYAIVVAIDLDFSMVGSPDRPARTLATRQS
jgi:hypothetical protein